MSDPLGKLPLSAVRAFEAAARLSSFSRAGEELGITQAAVSWQVRALEQRLGVGLFQRVGRGVVLTADGQRLSRAASEAVTLLRSAVADINRSTEGVLAITTFFTFANQWLAPRLGAYQLAHPQIAIRLETDSSVRDLQRDNLDVGIRAGSGEWPGLETHWLMPAVVTPLCSPALFESLGSPDDPGALLGAPRIGSEADWGLWFKELGLTGAERRARFAADNQQAEVASALAGQGVALGSPILFAGEIGSGRLVQPFSTVAVYSAGYWVTYPAERRRTPKIARFCDWLMAEAAADPAVIGLSSLAAAGDSGE